MQICVFTLGSEGDVRPFVALGRRLQALGHKVVIVTDTGHHPLIEGEGIEHVGVRADFAEVMRRNRALMNGTNPIGMWRDLNQTLQTWAPNLVERGERAIDGSDLVIGSGWGTVFGGSIARKKGIPFVQAQFQPLTPSRHLRPLWLLSDWQLPGWLNLVLHHATRQMMWRLLAPAAQAMRRHLDMPPLPWRGPWYAPEERAAPSRILYAFSRHIQPMPPDWPRERAEVVGFWALNQSSSWTPPQHLLDFLKAGPPPIYVGFGSMISSRPEEFTRTVLDAVRLSGRRAIVSLGWGALSADATELPNDVLPIDRAPHDWLFRHVGLAVHHGGAGTTAAVARAGLPQVIIPFVADQPYWASRTREIGVSPVILKQKTLTAERLGAAIREAGTPAIIARARHLAAEMSGEDGIANAVAALERWGLLPRQDTSVEQRARSEHLALP